MTNRYQDTAEETGFTCYSERKTEWPVS